MTLEEPIFTSGSSRNSRVPANNINHEQSLEQQQQQQQQLPQNYEKISPVVERRVMMFNGVRQKGKRGCEGPPQNQFKKVQVYLKCPCDCHRCSCREFCQCKCANTPCNWHLINPIICSCVCHTCCCTGKQCIV